MLSFHVAYACILMLTLTEACMHKPRGSCIFTTCSATFRKCGFGPVYYQKETFNFKSEESSKPTLSKVRVCACILQALSETFCFRIMSQTTTTQNHVLIMDESRNDEVVSSLYDDMKNHKYVALRATHGCGKTLWH